MFYIFYVALAAWLGGIIATVIGYLESKEKFDARKFGSGIFRAVIAAAIFAITYQFAGKPEGVDYLYAFLAGAGVDVIGHRVATLCGNGSFPLTNRAN